MPEHEAPTVTVGTITATLQPVPMLAALTLTEDGPISLAFALGAAALRMAWPESVAWPAKRRPRPWTVRTNTADWGAEAFDALYRESGMKLVDLAAILNKAREWAAMSAVSEAEVQAAEDFSDAPEAQGG
jgi:hypothetical protein